MVHNVKMHGDGVCVCVCVCIRVCVTIMPRVRRDMKKSRESTYAKVHGSLSVHALQRKEAEESACSKVHETASKITEIYFQEKLLC